jgi:hypothetical protein
MMILPLVRFSFVGFQFPGNQVAEPSGNRGEAEAQVSNDSLKCRAKCIKNWKRQTSCPGNGEHLLAKGAAPFAPICNRGKAEAGLVSVYRFALAKKLTPTGTEFSNLVSQIIKI